MSARKAGIPRQARETVKILAKDSGYVFANIHNLLSEIGPEKVWGLVGLGSVKDF